MSDFAAELEALIFDLDGVLTDTASLHLRAWTRLFDEVLRAREGEDFEPFTESEYRRWVDGKPRYEGARSFLRSRDIEMPFGDPDDPPEAETVCGLGNRKNQHFQELLETEGVAPFPDALSFLRRAREHGLHRAVVTSSRNGRRVVDAAEGLAELLEACVDGTELGEGLDGKPAPDLFVEAARRVGVEPAAAAVFEDARVGVEAGRRGGFARVVGVARDGDDRPLREAGADLVVERLDQIDLNGSAEDE